MRLAFLSVTAGVALTVFAQGAAAQDWQQKKQHQKQQQQQQQPYQQPYQPPYQPSPPQPQRPPQAGGGGACVASGFARLSRNCSVNTGGCQRMPDNCNRGWCCP
jgi:hemolysin activation/secretion protein